MLVRGMKITLDPPGETVSQARLDVLGAKIGGWGQGLVRWVAERSLEVREQSVEAEERAKRKREESSEVMGEEGEEGHEEEEERKRVKI